METSAVQAKDCRGLAQVFLAVNTTPKPAAQRFVVFEAWAFLLPSLGDFLGCSRTLLLFSPTLHP
jgi:hypothetical protein